MAAIQEELKRETRGMGDRNVKKWLIKEIQAHDGWLYACKSQVLCEMLSRTQDFEYSLEDSYYRDVFVWLPDIIWNDSCMPACPTCFQDQHVVLNGWPEWVGRRVFDIDTCYYIMTRRYCCSRCKRIAAQTEEKKNKPQYGFHGWNKNLILVSVISSLLT